MRIAYVTIHIAPEIMKGVVARELFGREFVAYR